MIKEHRSWEDIDKIANQLENNIRQKNTNNIKAITGLPRGGLVLAVLLSHRLGIPYLGISTVMVDYSIKPKDVLVVDDICDSGITLKPFVDKGYTTVTIDLKVGAIIVPDYYVNVIEKEKWIVYPWERNSTPILDGTLKKQILKD